MLGVHPNHSVPCVFDRRSQYRKYHPTQHLVHIASAVLYVVMILTTNCHVIIYLGNVPEGSGSVSDKRCKLHNPTCTINLKESWGHNQQLSHYYSTIRMIRASFFLQLVLISICCISTQGLKLYSGKWKLTKIQAAPAALLLSFGLFVAPTVCTAYAYNEPVVVNDKLDQNDGAQDIFAGAFQASQLLKQSALKNNDFELVKQGLMKQSSEPRALKRRVLVSCKDPELRQKAQADLTESACVSKVMGGDLKFMLDVIEK